MSKPIISKNDNGNNVTIKLESCNPSRKYTPEQKRDNLKAIAMTIAFIDNNDLWDEYNKIELKGMKELCKKLPQK